MFASVVIPTYERPAKLERTLESLCEQTADEYEVLVVDDGSESDKQEVVLDHYENRDCIEVVRQDNAGPAAARNRGWQRAVGDVVLFTDDDCIVPEDWIESLVSAFEKSIAAVGGPLMPRSDLLKTNQFARAHLFRDQMHYQSPDEPTTGHEGLNVGGTANVAYRRAVLDEVNGFDESFPLAAGEDADLQKRVLDSGYELKFVPTPVRHNDEYDWGSFISRAIRSGQGTYWFHEKHGQPRSAARILVGLLASLLYFPTALTKSREVGVAVLYVLERGLNRWGELKATLWSPN